MKKKDSFTRLDLAGSRGLGSLMRGRGGNAAYFESRWADVLGPFLSRKIAPADFSAGSLRLSVQDATCRKAVASLLPEIEKKLRDAFPNVSSVRLL